MGQIKEHEPTKRNKVKQRCKREGKIVGDSGDEKGEKNRRAKGGEETTKDVFLQQSVHIYRLHMT